MWFFILVFSHLLYGGYGYNYTNFLDWSGDCTTGKKQSPIDLRAVQVIEQLYDSRPPLYFKNYNATPLQVELEHVGYTVRLKGNWQGNTPEVTGPDVLSGNTYVFNNFHLHWSTNNNNGTEHSINGKKFAVELHIVHYNSGYQSYGQAWNKPDGIMIISVLYYVDDAVAPNPGMKLLITSVESLRTEGSKNTFPQLELTQLLPNPFGSFYFYSGSQVIPDCIENIRWIVMAEPQPITTQIINAFRKVTIRNGDTHNTRPLQATNNRLVEFYKQYTEKKSLPNFIKTINFNIKF